MTALAAALAALDVATAYLELAEQHAAAAGVERDERYARARDALVARYRADKEWIRAQSTFQQLVRGGRAA